MWWPACVASGAFSSLLGTGRDRFVDGGEENVVTSPHRQAEREKDLERTVSFDAVRIAIDTRGCNNAADCASIENQIEVNELRSRLPVAFAGAKTATLWPESSLRSRLGGLTRECADERAE